MAELGLSDKVEVYVTFEQPSYGRLELRAYDDKNVEVGRSKLRESASASSAE